MSSGGGQSELGDGRRVFMEFFNKSLGGAYIVILRQSRRKGSDVCKFI